MDTPLRIIARIECRGQRSTSTEYYECAVAAPADATLESLSPYALEKTASGPFGITVKRTRFTVEQYDPTERTLLVSHSLPRSKSADLTFEMEYGYGFKRNYEMGLAHSRAAHPATPAPAVPAVASGGAAQVTGEAGALMPTRTLRFAGGVLHIERGACTDAEAADLHSDKGPLLEAWDSEMPADKFFALPDFDDQ